MTTPQLSRSQLVEMLNEDLAREYQAIIAYVIYSQVLKGAEYMSIAKELEKHAGEELAHALKLSKHIDYLGGMPTTKVMPVKVSDDPKVMLRADLENAVKYAVARLQREQHGDGGWGWFPYDQSNPLTTTYALLGLLESLRQAEIPKILRQHRQGGHVVDGNVEETLDLAGM